MNNKTEKGVKMHAYYTFTDIKKWLKDAKNNLVNETLNVYSFLLRTSTIISYCLITAYKL